MVLHELVGRDRFLSENILQILFCNKAHQYLIIWNNYNLSIFLFFDIFEMWQVTFLYTNLGT